VVCSEPGRGHDVAKWLSECLLGLAHGCSLLLLKDDEVLWRKGSYEVHQSILPLVETVKRLERSPLEWLRAVVTSCIEKADYSLSEELVLSTPSR
jgi:hypothetical protein